MGKSGYGQVWAGGAVMVGPMKGPESHKSRTRMLLHCWNPKPKMGGKNPVVCR